MERAVANSFLERILIHHERSQDRTRPVLQKIDYTSFGHDAEAMRAFLERLRAAKEAGAVELELGRGVHRETIVRVRLLDHQKLAAFLGKDTAAAVAQKGQLALATLFAVCPDWVRAIGDEVLDKWRRRREACSLKPGDIEGLRELLMLLAAFDRGHHRGLDIRTFSMKAGCHSKAFEAHAAAIGTILKARLPDDIKAQDLSSEEVLDYLGLQKFQQPILVSGPLRWGNVDLSAMRPFVGLPPEAIQEVGLVRAPTYVLTIENLASFNRYVREIQDGGLVVFTGGFPSRSVVRLLERTIELWQDMGVPVAAYHWGDVDLGGLRIFQFLESIVFGPRNVSLSPHLMTIELARERGQKAKQPPSQLVEIWQSNSVATALAAYLLEGGATLEQESLDPVSPRPS